MHLYTHLLPRTNPYPLSLAQSLESTIYTSLSSIFQLSHGRLVYTEFGKWGQPGESTSEAVAARPRWCAFTWQTCSRRRGEGKWKCQWKGAISEWSRMVPFQSHPSVCTGWAEHSPRGGRERGKGEIFDSLQNIKVKYMHLLWRRSYFHFYFIKNTLFLDKIGKFIFSVLFLIYKFC